MTRYALPCAGLLAIAGSGCAGRRAESQTTKQVETAQQQSQQALDRAAKAQQEASKQAERVGQAQRDVQDSQRRLNAAQQRLQNEQAKAQQLQQRAIEARKEAAGQIEASQQEAARALEKQREYVQSQQQTFSGQVSQATPDSIVVTPQSGRPMTFKVTDRTQVRIDGREATAAEIQQGGDAHVAYEMTGTEPTAISVQVITSQPRQAPQPPPAAEPGPEPSTPGAPSAPSEPSIPPPQRP